MKLFSTVVALVVRNGRVSCPRGGDADVDRCLECPRLERVEGDVGGLNIICRLSVGLLDGDYLLGWLPFGGGG